MLVYLNKDMKHYLVDSVQRKNVPFLTIKLFEATSCTVISYTVMKHLSVSLVGIVFSLTPLIIVIMAWCFLKETLHLIDCIKLLIGVVGVMLFVAGSTQQHIQTDPDTQFKALLALFAAPVILASGSIAMRKMKKLHFSIISSYSNFILLVLSITAMLLEGSSLTFYRAFSPLTWVLLVAIALLVLGNQITQFMAYKYHKASALQVYFFATTIFQVMFDLAIFNTQLSYLQVVGFSLLLSLYTASGVYYLYLRPSSKGAAESSE